MIDKKEFIINTIKTSQETIEGLKQMVENYKHEIAFCEKHIQRLEERIEEQEFYIEVYRKEADLLLQNEIDTHL